MEDVPPKQRVGAAALDASGARGTWSPIARGSRRTADLETRSIGSAVGSAIQRAEDFVAIVRKSTFLRQLHEDKPYKSKTSFYWRWSCKTNT